jgi:DNA-directed RNA polymerase subunit RPC12/RpoP
MGKIPRNVFALSEMVQCLIECSFCGNEIGSYGSDSFDIAESAHEDGWRADERNEIVRCPNCRGKRKPKN